MNEVFAVQKMFQDKRVPSVSVWGLGNNYANSDEVELYDSFAKAQNAIVADFPSRSDPGKQYCISKFVGSEEAGVIKFQCAGRTLAYAAAEDESVIKWNDRIGSLSRETNASKKGAANES